MQPLRSYSVLLALERMAGEIHFRLGSQDGGSVLVEPYSPMQEAESADEVDLVCEIVARELARRHRSASSNPGFVKMSIDVSPLVLWRLRDAQRHLRESRQAQWPANTSVERFYSRLLVESWHRYAESYWMGRLEMVSALAPA